MNLDKLFTKESTIKISVISINDKKITKSIFNQLNIKNPFDKHINLLENVLFLGYINDKTKWIIWKDNDFLYKYELKHLLQIKWIDVNRNTIKDLLEIYPTEVVKNAYHFVDGYTPKPGDVAFYYGITPDGNNNEHVAMVLGIRNDTLITIGGNEGEKGEMKIRYDKLSLGSKGLVGFGELKQ